MRRAIPLLLLPLLLAPHTLADQKRAAALYERGQKLLEAGKVDKAIPLFERSLEEDPKFFLAEFALGAAHVKK
ncbi:MAG: tetratricopeptide repeat protein, partial [Planctomycetota bacterium]